MDIALIDRFTTHLVSPATRRSSLGLVAAALFALGHGGEDAAARKRRRKRRKKRTGDPAPDRCLLQAETCNRGQKPRCCEDLKCDQTTVDDVSGSFCCQPEGTACTSYEGCCSRTCDFLVAGGACAPCRGRTCNAERPCCGGLACRNGYCDGCRDRATSCSSNAQCCFSNCTSGACLSALGGPCARDVDCRACYLNHQCAGACVNGACTV